MGGRVSTASDIYGVTFQEQNIAENMLLRNDHDVTAAWSLTPPEERSILSVLHYGGSET